MELTHCKGDSLELCLTEFGFSPAVPLRFSIVEIVFIAVVYEYFISCLPQALQVCSFPPSTPSLVLDVDGGFEDMDTVLPV